MDIEVRDVTRRFGSGGGATDALRGLSLEVTEPAAVALVGTSGSGKSTVLNLLGGLDRATSGSVAVRGTDVTTLRGRALVEHRRRVGFVFQAFHLVPGLTAVENVALPLVPRGRRGDTYRRADALLERVGLAGRRDALPGELSGGQRQRVAIARALVADPVLVLADEPTGNLDTENARAVLDLLLEVRAEAGATLLVATHDPDVAARCDRTVRIADGRVEDPG
ncbi:ABC transporter ATP-binding protein [Phycicoccus flavus]|uniref:ABC transporter ATP-binding protein n=1 Tax=Phycicoccus flavus TaxID=2502783 RepID=UPI000FEB838E|nr:ABC transporter ATP-binding protein [Phycicoccus flavus]NHA67492.1 ABC transporter ATP-binding protein [Phycicoccus flavus]